MTGAVRIIPSQPLCSLAPKTASGGKIRAHRIAPERMPRNRLYRLRKTHHRGQSRVGSLILGNTIGNAVASGISGSQDTSTQGQGGGGGGLDGAPPLHIQTASAVDVPLGVPLPAGPTSNYNGDPGAAIDNWLNAHANQPDLYDAASTNYWVGHYQSLIDATPISPELQSILNQPVNFGYDNGVVCTIKPDATISSYDPTAATNSSIDSFMVGQGNNGGLGQTWSQTLYFNDRANGVNAQSAYSTFQIRSSAENVFLAMDGIKTENLNTNYNSLALTPKDSVYWPPNDGAYIQMPVTLPAGFVLDRYGLDRGFFTSPAGIPYSARSLAPGSQNSPYSVFQLTQPTTVQAGVIMPWFGQPGMGVQYKLPTSVSNGLNGSSPYLKRP